MAVNVDQPGSDELSGNIDRLPRLRRRYIFRHSRDRAVAEGDVTAATKLLSGVDDVAVFEQQIVFDSQCAPAFLCRVITNNSPTCQRSAYSCSYAGTVGCTVLVIEDFAGA